MDTITLNQYNTVSGGNKAVFEQDDIQIILSRCSASLAIREMQIKTTMRYHLTPVRVANINKSTNVGEDLKKREP